MWKQAALLPLLVVAACASVERLPPLSGADIVMLARNGKSAPEIIDEIRRTDTVLPLQASDYVRLHDEGVPDQVLDYLQLVQIDDIRWRDRYSQLYWYGPMYRGMGPCPWLYRRSAWGC
jgi:hypothetical protein